MAILGSITARKEWLTKAILISFIPLAFLSFLCETDSVLGKVLLVVKLFAFCALFVLYYKQIKLINRVLIFFAVGSMIVTVGLRGGAGVFALISIALVAMITLPQIEIDKRFVSRLYISFAIVNLLVYIYGIVTNYAILGNLTSKGGAYNPNTLGLIVLSSFLFAIAAMDENKRATLLWQLLLTIVASILILLVNCRSAILSIVLYWFFMCLRKKKKWVWFYYILVILTMTIFLITVGLRFYTGEFGRKFYQIKIFDKAIFTGREYIWKYALERYAQKPILGVGGDYILHIDESWISSTHNVLLGILMMMGIVPASIYVWIILRPKTILTNREENGTLRIPGVCFLACLVITALECLFTDSRMCLLYLPLLLKQTNGSFIQIEANRPEDVQDTV